MFPQTLNSFLFGQSLHFLQNRNFRFAYYPGSFHIFGQLRVLHKSLHGFHTGNLAN